MTSQTVVVTGASAGFGAEIARRFVATGARVIAAARREDRLAALAAELGEHLEVVTLDVRDRAAVERALAGLEVDMLVNNAGLALGLEPAPRADLDDWEQMVDTNCKGLMYVTRACCPAWSRDAAVTSSTSARSPARTRIPAATSTARRKRSCTSSA